MITVKDIERLAELSRIQLADDEKAGLVKEIDSILAYVDQIKSASVDFDHATSVTLGADARGVKNVSRPDTPRTISAEDRRAVLDAAPDREGDFVAVKKIL